MKEFHMGNTPGGLDHTGARKGFSIIENKGEGLVIENYVRGKILIAGSKLMFRVYWNQQSIETSL